MRLFQNQFYEGLNRDIGIWSLILLICSSLAFQSTPRVYAPPNFTAHCMDFLEQISSKITLSPTEQNRIDKAFKTERHAKNSILMMPGANSQKATFVEKGLLRTYYTHNDKDITHFFFEEGFVSMNIDSVFYNKPTPYGTEALEDVTLRTIQYRDFMTLAEEIPALKDYVFLTSIQMVKLFSDRLYSLQFHTAQERYTALLNDHPSILMRAPLGHIASYLGITQQTLSVIRSKTK